MKKQFITYAKAEADLWPIVEERKAALARLEERAAFLTKQMKTLIDDGNEQNRLHWGKIEEWCKAKGHLPADYKSDGNKTGLHLDDAHVLYRVERDASDSTSEMFKAFLKDLLT